MKKIYAKSMKEYGGPFAFEFAKILAAMRRFRSEKLKAVSIALDQVTVRKLKRLAEKRGIPYQVLIRALILDGMDRMKETS